MKNCKRFLGVLLIIPLIGCASFHTGDKEIKITTVPDDAYVYVDGWIVKTPATLAIKNDRSHMIMVKKEGYKYKETKPDLGIRYKEVFFGNILWTFGYPIAVAIDFISGNAFGVADTNIILEENK